MEMESIEVKETIGAIQIKHDKQQRHVGISLRVPRERDSCILGNAQVDSKCWEFVVFSFLDCPQVCTFETLKFVPTRLVFPSRYSLNSIQAFQMLYGG